MKQFLLGLAEVVRKLLPAPPEALPFPPCGGARPAVRRSSKWAAKRAEHLLKFPTCAACGTKEHLEVHHVRPFHLHPEDELKDENLLTLCETPSHNCHLIFGHLLLWASYNVDVRADAGAYLLKVTHRPRRGAA